MAKKKSKQQLNHPNAANISHTATAETTDQPASTSRDDVYTPAISEASELSNHHSDSESFFDFITLATIEDIRSFLQLASTTPDGKNLENLWRRAHGEGYEKGRKSLLRNLEKKMEDKFEEGVERGMNLGREQGYTVAKEGFDSIIKALKAKDTPRISTSDSGMQMNPPVTISMSVGTQTSPTTCVATSQSPAPFENRKNAKIGSPSCNFSKIPSYSTVFSSPMPSVTSTNSATSSTITIAPETRSTTTNFTPKHQKVEISPIPHKTTPKTTTPSTSEPINDITRVYASATNPNDAFLQPPTISTSASSSQHTQLPADITEKKSALLRAVFASQQPTGSPAPTYIVTSQEMRSESTDFTENYQKVEKSANFIQNHPKSPVLEHFDWASDAAELPLLSTTPTKQPRDFSGLRTSSKNSFSSLQRRHRKFNKNSFHFINSKPRYHSSCYHSFSGPYRHFQNFHYHPQHPFSVSLDWDRDPRLSDLSTAL